MGTRADFYVGKGKSAEWIGSIAWDGYRDGIPDDVLKADTSRKFRAAVKRMLKSRDDGTTPDMGWPWPWNDSGTSDCHYWFFDNQVWDGHSDYEASGPEVYVPVSVKEPGGSERSRRKFFKGRERIEFPDMSARKNTTMGARSGVILISA